MNFTVFNESTRTTSSVENYNGVLKKKGTVHGNFFKFVSLLQNEELFKSNELEESINNVDEIPAKRVKTQDYFKSVFIQKLNKKLVEKKICENTFLELFVDKSSIFRKIDDLNNDYDDVEEIEDEKSGAEDDLIGSCSVCKVNNSNIVALPCKHLKTCSECHLKLQAVAISEQEPLKCVICRVEIMDTIQVFN